MEQLLEKQGDGEAGVNSEEGGPWRAGDLPWGGLLWAATIASQAFPGLTLGSRLPEPNYHPHPFSGLLGTPRPGSAHWWFPGAGLSQHP